MAGPRYSSEFHQYDGHDVEQQAQRMHSYRPSSFLRSSLLCRNSFPYGDVSKGFPGSERFDLTSGAGVSLCR